MRAKQRSHRIWQLIGLSMVVALLLAGCSAPNRADESPALSPDIPAPHVSDAGSTITVAVDSAHTLAIEVPGLGRVAAPSGAFSHAGKMVVQRLSSTSPHGSVIMANGPGIDVTFEGTSLVSPLTIYFDDPAVRRSIPDDAALVVLHKPDGAAWETRKIDYTADGIPYLVTKSFSPNILSWIPLPQWIKDFPQTLSNIATGTAEQRPCTGGGPSWGEALATSYLVYECLITNTSATGVPRAELQIQNSRDHPEWIHIPAGADYVWVDNEPTDLRNAIARVTGHDVAKYVLLGAGQWMTIGYPQPAADIVRYFTVEQDGWSFGLSVAQAIVGNGIDVPGWIGMLVLAGTCKVAGSKTAADYFSCFVTHGIEQLKDSGKASAAARQVLGDNSFDSAYATSLNRIKGNLQSAGRIAAAVGLVDVFQTILIPVVDAVATIQNPSQETFNLTLTAAKPAQTSPPRAAAPAPAAPAAPVAAPAPVAPPAAPAPTLPQAWVTRDGDVITYHWQDMPAGMWSQVDRFRCWRYGKSTHPGGWATDGCGQVTGYAGYPSGTGSVSFNYAGAQDSFSVEPWKYGPWLGVGERCTVGGTPAC